MAFVFERIKPGDPVEQTLEYQKAIKHKLGGGFNSRVVDDERNASLYCLSVNEWEERPPGEYLLFYKGQLIRILAYKQGPFGSSWENSYTRFRIVSVLVHEIAGKQEEISDVLVEALEAEGRGTAVRPVSRIKIEFMNGWETRK
jgi:hypothetical protein